VCNIVIVYLHFSLYVWQMLLDTLVVQIDNLIIYNIVIVYLYFLLFKNLSIIFLVSSGLADAIRYISSSD